MIQFFEDDCKRDEGRKLFIRNFGFCNFAIPCNGFQINYT